MEIKGSLNRGNRLSGKDDPCIWMQAGVVPRKYCDIDYQCPECRFDRVLSHAAYENLMLKQTDRLTEGKRGKIVFWKDRLKSLPISKRPCIHNMKGRIDFRSCTNEYRCGNCDFNQYFQDQYAVHAAVNPVDILDIRGFKIPQGYYFHRGHTWVKIEEGSSVRVGLDDFALRLIGPLDRVESPLMGKEIKQDRPDISIVRGENEAKLLSPVNGVVTDINVALRDRGNIANDDPYTEGWIMRVQSDSLRRDVKHLMISREAEDFIEGQISALYDMIEETAGSLAADGGNLSSDIFGSMPQLGWERLTKIFLHA